MTFKYIKVEDLPNRKGYTTDMEGWFIRECQGFNEARTEALQKSREVTVEEFSEILQEADINWHELYHLKNRDDKFEFFAKAILQALENKPFINERGSDDNI